ncbi:MAG: ClpXP protease specificity-enhancing factor [Betaproteobacteria bacterium]|nr:ClpXP protease specificity-enhancing factor [Betaproteobacteria bacterium]
MSTHSTKPYLIRAIHEWCSDQGHTPYLAVAVDEHTQVPMEYVKAGEIVLNVSLAATNRLRLGNDWIEFQARFGGVARDISIPIGNVSAIYARETGHGMAFEVSKAPAHVQAQSSSPAPASPSQNPATQTASIASLALASSQRAPGKAGRSQTASAPSEEAKRMRSVGPKRQTPKSPTQSDDAMAAAGSDNQAQALLEFQSGDEAKAAKHHEVASSHKPESGAGKQEYSSVDQESNPDRRENAADKQESGADKPDANASLSAAKKPMTALSSVDKQNAQDGEVPLKEGASSSRARGAARGAAKSRPKLTRVK